MHLCGDKWQWINWYWHQISKIYVWRATNQIENNSETWRSVTQNDRKLAKQYRTVQFSSNNSSVWVIWFFWKRKKEENFCCAESFLYFAWDPRTKQLNCRLSGIAKPRNKVKRGRRGVTYVSVVRINCSLIQYWVRIESMPLHTFRIL